MSKTTTKPEVVKVTAKANREAWLWRMTQKFRPAFAKAGKPLPERIKVTCGWPSFGGTGKVVRVIGECWHPKCSKTGHHEIFVSPLLADAVEVGAVLVHELCHAAAGHEAGHGPDFKAIAEALGLTGPMRATEAGEALKVTLTKMAESLGAYPHGGMTLPEGGPKMPEIPGMPIPPGFLPPVDKPKIQRNRHRKCVCPTEGCGYTVRLTKPHLERGLPVCGACYSATGNVVVMALAPGEADHL